MEKSLSGFHFHMVINHLRRLCSPPSPSPSSLFMLITGLVWLMSLCLTYFSPGCKVARFHLKRQMNRKDKGQMIGLDFLCSWGEGRRSVATHPHLLLLICFAFPLRIAYKLAGGPSTFSAAKGISCNWDKSTVLNLFLCPGPPCSTDH